jgi:DNA mismatch repair protein MSH2
MMASEEKTYNEAEDRGIRGVLKLLPNLENTIRLFDRGEYFSAYGDHAIYIANQVFKTTNALKYMNGDRGQEIIPVCTLGKLQAESFIRDGLVNKQLKIEIWATSGSPAKGPISKIENSPWKLVRKGSPGNLGEFEDILFNQDAELGSIPMIVALWITSGQSKGQENLMIALAFADTTSRILGYSEFPDNELFSNLESALIQLNVKECILPERGNTDHPESIKARSIIDRCSVVITEAKKGEMVLRRDEYLPKIVQRIVKSDSSIILFI